MANPAEIMRLLERLPDTQRAHIEAELIRYEMRWLKSRTKREVTVTPASAARRVAANALLDNMYFLYENTSMPASTSAS